MIFEEQSEQISKNGYIIINDIFPIAEVEKIISIINQADSSKPVFRK